MAPLLIGYARVSTDEQVLTAQREALEALGVSAERIYVDHGPTGTNRDRPGLRETLAACREGDMQRGSGGSAHPSASLKPKAAATWRRLASGRSASGTGISLNRHSPQRTDPAAG